MGTADITRVCILRVSEEKAADGFPADPIREAGERATHNCIVRLILNKCIVEDFGKVGSLSL